MLVEQKYENKSGAVKLELGSSLSAIFLIEMFKTKIKIVGRLKVGISELQSRVESRVLRILT